MAVRAAFCAQNQTINAEPVREAVSSLVPNGGGIVQAGDYAVTQTGTPSMAVAVAAGRIWVPGTNVSNVTGQAWSTQGQYHIENDAPVTVTVQPSDATNPRIDVVYVGMADSQYAGATDGPTIAVQKGTAIAGASYPANAPAIPANSIAIAWINVAANAASILNANITQLQVNGLGYTSQVLALTTANFNNPPSGYSAPTFAYNAFSRVATLTGHVVWTNGSNGNQVATIPSGYRPTYQVAFSSVSQANSTGNLGTLYRGTIETSGVVTLNWMGGGVARSTDNVIPIQATWLLP